jgi:hypothetical protein
VLRCRQYCTCTGAVLSNLLLVLAGCGAHWEFADSLQPAGSDPVLTLASPAADSAWVAGSVIPVLGTVDAVGDVQIELSSEVAGVLATFRLADDAPLDTTATLRTVGADVLTVLATDDQGRTAEVAVAVTITPATFPSTPVVQIAPETPGPGDALLATILEESVDPEGDPLSYSWSWTVDGVDAGLVGPDVAVDQVAAGQTWAVAVVATDGSSISEAAIDSVLIAPAVVVSIAPTAPVTGDTLSCSHDMAEAVTFSWTVDGVDAGVTTDTLEGVRRDQVVACIVTGESGRVAQAEVTIGNAPPTAPGVSFVREVVPGAPAVCTAAGSIDLEDDLVSYTWAWSVDGVVTADTDDTYDTAGLDVGAELMCVATPDDGLDLGPGAAASTLLIAPSAGDLYASDAWIVLAGSVAGASFGKSVDASADLDGDGLPELLVGAPVGEGSSKGAVYLYTSSTLVAGLDRLDTDADASWVGRNVGDALGGARGVEGVGDLDSDGIGDLVVSASGNDDGGADAGSVYVLYGGGTWTAGGDITNDADARLRGSAGDWLGTRLAGGDLDGDGLSDLAAGGPYNDLGGNKAGVVAVYLGDAARMAGGWNLDYADATVIGSAAESELGYSVDISADADGDGYGELVVGAFADDTNAGNAGAAGAITGSAVLGQVAWKDVAWLVVNGDGASGRFGYDVAAAGDLDGDGLGDLLFGEYLSDTGGSDAGRVAVMYGGAGRYEVIDAHDADRLIVGASAGGQLGSVLAGLGDWDDDGLDDFIVGAPRADDNGESAGYAGIYRGADEASWSTTASMRVLGDAAGDWLGDELSGGFDLDGDAYMDVALGAQQADPVASGGGAVYVFKGP